MSIIEPATVRTVRTATQYTIDIDGGIVIVVLSPSANGFSVTTDIQYACDNLSDYEASAQATTAAIHHHNS